MNVYVNKQNCRIWSEANPQVYVETPLHPEKLTVWCALWAGGIIGSGYVKSLVYADKPQTLAHLEDNIRRVIADIRPQMLEKVIENCTSRLDYIRAIRGRHMPEVIFKIQTLWGGGDIIIHICIAICGRTRLRRALDVIVHKSIKGNRPALPQSFEFSSPAKERDNFADSHKRGDSLPRLTTLNDSIEATRLSNPVFLVEKHQIIPH
ncbi:hypothetical protein TNCV_2248331 [Trichonephila clavipes]|nr:hypothetical protein TNCV_2248331 [Trichonephila clavipes]